MVPIDWMWPAAWLVMLLVWLVVIGAIVAGIVLIVRTARGSSARGTAGAGPHGDALRILEERFARGEIDPDEFEERRRILLDR